MPRWLAGEALDDLPPLAPPTPVELSTQFTAMEQVAIATALATPDICLITGEPSDRRVRVAHTIASRAGLRGDRVLVLSPEPIDCGGIACADGACCHVRAREPANQTRRTFWNWLTGLVRARPSATAAGAPNVVAATYRDPPAIPFDLVIAADAHTLSDAEITAVAVRGRRCTLIGTLSSHSSFGRLWQRLAFEPWAREGEHIVCRLRRIPDCDRGQLESEPVADRPDIELRILAEAGGEPQLAEVVFPQGMRIAEAKSYVFDQLGEAPLCNGLSGGTWSETADGIAVDLGGSANEMLLDVPLANGIRELVQPTDHGWTTCGLRFARSAGWSRDSAGIWVEQHCGRHDRGRTVCLDRVPTGKTEASAGRAAKALAQ
jgi:hypothetical protein